MGLQLIYKGQRYEQIKSKGDGNCLFNSFAIWFILTSLKTDEFNRVSLANGTIQNWTAHSYQNILIKDTVEFFTRRKNLEGVNYIARYKEIIRNHTLLELQEFMSTRLRIMACNGMDPDALYPIFEGALAEHVKSKVLAHILNKPVPIQDDIFSPIGTFTTSFELITKIFTHKLSQLDDSSEYKTLLREYKALQAETDTILEQPIPVGKFAPGITTIAAHAAMIAPIRQKLLQKQKTLKQYIINFIEAQLPKFKSSIRPGFDKSLFKSFKDYMSKSGTYAGDYELSILCARFGINWGMQMSEAGPVTAQLPEARSDESLDVIFYHGGAIKRHWDPVIAYSTLQHRDVRAICHRRPTPFNPKQVDAKTISLQLEILINDLMGQSRIVAADYDIIRNPMPILPKFKLSQQLLVSCIQFHNSLKDKLRDICSSGAFEELTTNDIELIYFQLNIVSYISALSLHGNLSDTDTSRIRELLFAIYPSLVVFYRACQATTGGDRTYASIRHIMLCYSLLLFAIAHLAEGNVSEKARTGVVTLTMPQKHLTIDTQIASLLRPSIKIKYYAITALRAAERRHVEILEIKKHLHLLVTSTIKSLNAMMDKNPDEIKLLNDLLAESNRITAAITHIQENKRIRQVRYRQEKVQRAIVDSVSSSPSTQVPSSAETTPSKNPDIIAPSTKIVGSPCYLGAQRHARIHAPSSHRSPTIVQSASRSHDSDSDSDSDCSSVSSSYSDVPVIGSPRTTKKLTASAAAAVVTSTVASSTSAATQVSYTTITIPSTENPSATVHNSIDRTQSSAGAGAGAAAPASVIASMTPLRAALPKPMPKQAPRSRAALPKPMPTFEAQRRARPPELTEVAVRTALYNPDTTSTTSVRTEYGELMEKRRRIGDCRQP